MNYLLQPAIELIEAWAEAPIVGNSAASYALHRLFNALEDNEPEQYRNAFNRGVARSRAAYKRTADKIDGYDQDDLGESPDY